MEKKRRAKSSPKPTPAPGYEEAVFTYVEKLRETLERELASSGKQTESRARSAINALFKALYLTGWWCVPVKCDSVLTDNVDRTKAILLGPLFTSIDFPWPRESERYMEPIAQFDLEAVGNLGGIDLGSGMLQLWIYMDGDFEGYIRVIPKQDVDITLLSPIPNEIYLGSPDVHEGSTHWSEWLKEGGKSLVMNPGLTRRIEYLSHVSESLTAALPALPEVCRAEASALLDFLSGKSKIRMPKVCARFFGTFYQVQYSPNEMPSCLLAFESSWPFTWGDCGNAQIFYKKNNVDGRLEFSFAWSCH